MADAAAQADRRDPASGQTYAVSIGKRVKELLVGVNSASGVSVKHAPVYINMYDLSHGLVENIGADLAGRSVPGGKAFHTSVSFLGFEFYFEGCVSRAPVGTSRFGAEFVTEEVGVTSKSLLEFEAWVRNQEAVRYGFADYRIVSLNCNHFTTEAVEFLCGDASKVPSCIHKSTDVLVGSLLGSVLTPIFDRMTTGIVVLLWDQRRRYMRGFADRVRRLGEWAREGPVGDRATGSSTSVASGDILGRGMPHVPSMQVYYFSPFSTKRVSAHGHHYEVDSGVVHAEIDSVMQYAIRLAMGYCEEEAEGSPMLGVQTAVNVLRLCDVIFHSWAVIVANAEQTASNKGDFSFDGRAEREAMVKKFRKSLGMDVVVTEAAAMFLAVFTFMCQRIAYRGLPLMLRLLCYWSDIPTFVPLAAYSRRMNRLFAVLKTEFTKFPDAGQVDLLKTACCYTIEDCGAALAVERRHCQHYITLVGHALLSPALDHQLLGASLASNMIVGLLVVRRGTVTEDGNLATFAHPLYRICTLLAVFITSAIPLQMNRRLEWAEKHLDNAAASSSAVPDALLMALQRAINSYVQVLSAVAPTGQPTGASGSTESQAANAGSPAAFLELLVTHDDFETVRETMDNLRKILERCREVEAARPSGPLRYRLSLIEESLLSAAMLKAAHSALGESEDSE